MAIIDAKKRRIGRELVDWIHLGIRTGARRSVANYRQLKADGRQAEAIEQITRAVNMPRRARERITEWIRVYDLANGVGAAQTFLAGCLTLAGSVTLGEINGDLTTLETAANNFIAANQSGGTLDEMATALEAALENEANQWQFPFPAGYEDIALLDN